MNNHEIDSCLATMKKLMDDKHLIEAINSKGKNLKKEKVKMYKPKRETIEGLRELKYPFHYEVIRHVTPLYKHVYTATYEKAEELLRVVRKELSLNKSNMLKMEEETKQEIIKNSLIGWEKGLMESQEYWVNPSKGVYFQDDYNKNKMKYLMDFDGRPIIFENTKLEILNRNFLKLIEQFLHAVLKTESYARKRIVEIDKYNGAALVVEFWIALEKETEILKYDLKESVYRYFVEKARKGLTESDIRMYMEMPWCPISEKVPKDIDVDFKNVYAVYHVSALLENFSEMKKLLSGQGLNNLVSYLNKIGEKVQGIIEEKGELKELGSQEDIERILNILSYLPDVYDYLCLEWNTITRG